MDLNIIDAHKTPLARLMQKKKAQDDFNKNIERKSMIRYLTIIIDFSRSTLKQDLRPNRASVIKENLILFIHQYMD
jgi:hypothetical protein